MRRDVREREVFLRPNSVFISRSPRRSDINIVFDLSRNGVNFDYAILDILICTSFPLGATDTKDDESST